MIETDLSVVLPCYNEAGTLPALLARYAEVAAAVRLELVLVDNGSTDATPQVLDRELRHPQFAFARRLRLERNLGYGHGIRAGLAVCRSSVVGFSHADLQCPPEDVLRAYAIYREVARAGPVVVKGRRIGRSGLEGFVSRTYSGLSRLILGIPPLDVNGQPKLFPRALVPELLDGPSDFSFDLYALAMAARLGSGFEEFGVRFEPRQTGVSKWAATPWSRAAGIARAFAQILRLRAVLG